MSWKAKAIVVSGAWLLWTSVTLAQVDVFNWTSAFDDEWGRAAPWDFNDFPQTGDEARHETEGNRITVLGTPTDPTGNRCLRFIGNGAAPGDRFLLIESVKTLTLEESISGVQGVFPVRIEDGTDAANRTTLKVGVPNAGSVDSITLEPLSGQTGEYILIDVNGDVTNTTIDLPGKHNQVLVTGSLTGSSVTLSNQDSVVNIGGNVSGTSVTFGGGASTFDVGGNVSAGTWTFNGSAVFTADQPGTSVSGGTWSLNNTSQGAVAATSNGTWTIDDTASVTAGSVTGGAWTVISTASPGLNVTGTLNPGSLTLDGNGMAPGAEAACGQFGSPTGQAADLTMQDVTKLTAATGWHRGKLTYSGGKGADRNQYFVTQLHLDGELDQVAGGFLDIHVDAGGQVAIDAQLVGANGTENTFEPGGVFLIIDPRSGAGSVALETISPDYSNYNGVDKNPDGVFFTDSPCMDRWINVEVQSGMTLTLQDAESNSPVSGGPSASLPDALYVQNLDVNGSVIPGGLNIYFTTSCSPSNSDFCQSVATPLVIRNYGDFNGNNIVSGSPGNPDPDVLRFNASFPCNIDTGCSQQGDVYDPLVDWNCDGSVDSQDRDRFMVNWPGATGVDCETNADCDDSGDVCTFDCCSALTCTSTVETYGDVAGGTSCGGTCGPDGPPVDLIDILAVLDAFSGSFPSGCDVHNFDIAPCPPDGPDGQVTLLDTLAVLDAFAGTDACCSGSAPAPPPGGGGIINVHPVPIDAEIRGGETVEVDILASGLKDLRGYEMAIEIVPLLALPIGEVYVESGYIDETRGDYAFTGLTTYTRIDAPNARFVSALDQGGVTERSGVYFGTFVLRASPDALGTFDIVIRSVPKSDTRDSGSWSIQLDTSAVASITVVP